MVVGLIAFLLLLLLLLLLLPLDLHLRLDSDWAAPTWEEEMTGALRWLLRLRWGWVVIDGAWTGEFLTVKQAAIRICGFGGRSQAKRAGAPGRKPKRKATPKAKTKSKSLDLELLMALVPEVAAFLFRLVRATGLRMAGDVTYGFADPSLTGWCEAIRWSSHLPLPVRLEPDFTRTALTGWAEADGRLNLFKVLRAAWPALADPVIRSRLAEKIRFGPIHYWLARGGK
ncbi:MAG: hypothetical protein ACM3XM_13810 [Mycobacterium leprae]